MDLVSVACFAEEAIMLCTASCWLYISYPLQCFMRLQPAFQTLRDCSTAAHCSAKTKPKPIESCAIVLKEGTWPPAPTRLPLLPAMPAYTMGGTDASWKGQTQICSIAKSVQSSSLPIVLVSKCQGHVGRLQSIGFLGRINKYLLWYLPSYAGILPSTFRNSLNTIVA